MPNGEEANPMSDQLCKSIVNRKLERNTQVVRLSLPQFHVLNHLRGTGRCEAGVEPGRKAVEISTHSLPRRAL